MTLSDLIARLETASGPDRELDAAIHRLLAGSPTDHWYNFFGEWITDQNCPHISASIDAAVALAERVLPGWTWSIAGCPEDFLTDKDKPFSAELIGPVSWKVIDREVGEEPVYETAHAQHSLPAIALLIAILKAKEASDEA